MSTDSCSLLIPPDSFWVLLLLTTGSMRSYLQLHQAAQVVQLLQEDTSIPVVTRRFVSASKVSRAWRRHQETPGDVTPGDSRRAGGGGGAGVFLTKLSETDSMRRPEGRRPLVGPELTAQHRAARLALARKHQNHWRPVLFTAYSRFTLSTCERRE